MIRVRTMSGAKRARSGAFLTVDGARCQVEAQENQQDKCGFGRNALAIKSLIQSLRENCKSAASWLRRFESYLHQH